MCGLGVYRPGKPGLSLPRLHGSGQQKLGREWLPFTLEFAAGLGVQPRGAGGLALLMEREGTPTLPGSDWEGPGGKAGSL